MQNADNIPLNYKLIMSQSGAKSKSCGQKSKNRLFSFRLKLILHYSKLFVDLSMYNVFVLCVNLRSFPFSKVRSFRRFWLWCEFNEILLCAYNNEALLI